MNWNNVRDNFPSDTGSKMETLRNNALKNGVRDREVKFTEKRNRLKTFILCHPEIFGQLNEYYISLLNAKTALNAPLKVLNETTDYEKIYITKSDLQTIIMLLRLRIDCVLKSQNESELHEQQLLEKWLMCRVTEQKNYSMVLQAKLEAAQAIKEVSFKFLSLLATMFPDEAASFQSQRFGDDQVDILLRFVKHVKRVNR